MIYPLITDPKQDNDLQLARTASIPANEKYYAKEWNAIVDKINEIINDLSLGQITDSVTKTTASNIVRLVEGALIETNLTIRNLPEATTEQKMILLNSLGEAALADISDYFADTRLSNLADDLDETEQNDIKTKLGVGGYNGVTPTITEDVITSYSINPQTETEHWNLTMAGDTDFNFTNMFASGNSKVITITLKGDYAFTFPSWLKPLETNDEYDTIEGTLVAEIVINIKNGGTNPSGYYSLQMIDYAL